MPIGHLILIPMWIEERILRCQFSLWVKILRGNDDLKYKESLPLVACLLSGQEGKGKVRLYSVLGVVGEEKHPCPHMEWGVGGGSLRVILGLSWVLWN